MKNKIDCWKTTDSWNLKPLRSSRGNRVLIENRSESKVLGVINGNVELVENQRGQSWFKGEPNNQGGQDNCVEVYSDPGQSWHDKWNDIPCNQKRNYVCKKQPVGGKSK